LLSQLNSEEIVHKEIVSSRVSIRNQIQSIKEALIAIRKTVAEYETNLSPLLSLLESTESQMSESTSKIQVLQEMIDSLEAKIEQAKKVCIYAWDSGEIEIESKTSIEIPEWINLRDEIVKEGELNSLTVNQINVLAKSIVLTRFLISQQRLCEVIFESTLTKAYFEKAIS
jgi:chromosome segregation ATPase